MTNCFQCNALVEERSGYRLGKAVFCFTCGTKGIRCKNCKGRPGEHAFRRDIRFPEGFNVLGFCETCKSEAYQQKKEYLWEAYADWIDEQPGPAYIYGLYEEGSSAIRYIGRTIHPTKRLFQHREKRGSIKKTEWINTCDYIDMGILEECESGCFVYEREVRWIMHGLQTGMDLTNAERYRPDFVKSIKPDLDYFTCDYEELKQADSFRMIRKVRKYLEWSIECPETLQDFVR